MTATVLPAVAVHAVRQENLYHEARLLILISRFTDPEQPLRGLTKIAKLDFLLRYPVMAERLLPPDASRQDIAPTGDERYAVESRMIRYKYGPWDDRYYPLLGALVGKGLATYATVDGSTEITLTGPGRTLADTMAAADAWAGVARRAGRLREYFDLPGTALRDLIYQQLPDVVDRPLRSEI